VLVTTATTNDALHAAKNGHTARWGSTKVFFLGQFFLPEGTRIFGYREISKISRIYWTK
jgi:hypothetical protein